MPEKLDPNLGLSYGWDEGEDGWAPGADKNAKRLGTFVGLDVISADVATPPGSPTEGDAYIVASPATDAWVGQENSIAVYLEGAWEFHPPSASLRAFLQPEIVTARWDGTQWLRGERLARLVDVAGALQGMVTPTSSPEGVALVRTTDGLYDPQNGALVVSDGRLQAYGSQVELPGMAHTEDAGLPLYVAPDGQLFLGPAPPNLWKQEATDPTDYTTLGSGTGTGPWVELTGSKITLAQNIEISHELLITTTLYIQNQSASRAGTVEIWWGESGLGDPGAVTPMATFIVAGGQDGLSVQSIAHTATSQILAGAAVTVYARRANGEQAAYEPQLLGSIEPHHQVLQRVS